MKKSIKSIIIIATVLLLALIVQACGTPSDEPQMDEQQLQQELLQQQQAEEQRLRQEEEQRQLLLLEKQSQYSEAVALQQDGQFLLAAQIFEELEDFEDSKALAEDCRNAESELWITAVADNRSTLAAGAWYTAFAGQAPQIYGDESLSAQPMPAQADAVFGGMGGAFYTKDGRLYPVGETFGQAEEMAALENVISVSAGFTHALVLHSDGSVTPFGSAAENQLELADWQGIIEVATGLHHSVGLRQDGTIVSTGDNQFGQCNVDQFSQVSHIAAGYNHTVILMQDGTVAAVGDNQFGQCDVSQWQDIISVACGAGFTLGLKSDYTVVAAGDNSCGQCDVLAWNGVIAVAGGAAHSVGLRLDDSLVFTGSGINGQCPAEYSAPTNYNRELEKIESVVNDSAFEFIYDTTNVTGPWSYISNQGAAIIAMDRLQAKMPLRVDLICTKDNLPSGFLTNPEASGNYIQMPSAMTKDLAVQNNCVLAFTGDFVGFTSNRKGVMMRQGRVYYDRAETSSMSINPDGTLTCYTQRQAITAQELIDRGVKDCFSFGPILMSEGVVPTTELSRDPIPTMRVGLGYCDPFHYIAVICCRDSNMFCSLLQLANIFKDYHCLEAYNLDGGHSTSLVFMGRELTMFTLINNPHENIRGLSDIVGFLQSDTVAAYGKNSAGN